MTTKLVDGLLALPKDKKLPLRWKQVIKTEGLIPLFLKDCFFQDIKKNKVVNY